MRKLSFITLKCNHKCLYKSGAEGDLTSAEDAILEARDWSDEREGSGANKWRFPESKKCQETIFP